MGRLRKIAKGYLPHARQQSYPRVLNFGPRNHAGVLPHALVGHLRRCTDGRASGAPISFDRNGTIDRALRRVEQKGGHSQLRSARSMERVRGLSDKSA